MPRYCFGQIAFRFKRSDGLCRIAMAIEAKREAIFVANRFDDGGIDRVDACVKLLFFVGIFTHLQTV